MTIQIVRTVSDLRSVVAGWHEEGYRVGVVPTMGALHDGHLSLVQQGLIEADRVVATIFVNPRQFNNAADLAAYPRTEESDAEKLDSAGAHLLFIPDAAEMYPPGFATTVHVSGVADALEGEYRPGHFDGVATVVAKLFLQTGADIALFGEKDFQQLLVVTRMARDLNIPIRVIGCPTVREVDGLAMSSRNVRLSEKDRGIAPKLSRIINRAATRIAGGLPAADVLAEARAALLAAGFRAVDYVELRAEDDFRPLDAASAPARILAAAWLGQTRLIDNVGLPGIAR